MRIQTDGGHWQHVQFVRQCVSISAVVWNKKKKKKGTLSIMQPKLPKSMSPSATMLTYLIFCPTRSPISGQNPYSGNGWRTAWEPIDRRSMSIFYVIFLQYLVTCDTLDVGSIDPLRNTYLNCGTPPSFGSSDCGRSPGLPPLTIYSQQCQWDLQNNAYVITVLVHWAPFCYSWRCPPGPLSCHSLCLYRVQIGHLRMNATLSSHL